MGKLHRRLFELEERKALKDAIQLRREFQSRPYEELLFFAAHGFFPENAGQGPLPTQEFTVGNIKTTITAERIGDDR